MPQPYDGRSEDEIMASNNQWDNTTGPLTPYPTELGPGYEWSEQYKEWQLPVENVAENENWAFEQRVSAPIDSPDTELPTAPTPTAPTPISRETQNILSTGPVGTQLVRTGLRTGTTTNTGPRNAAGNVDSQGVDLTQYNRPLTADEMAAQSEEDAPTIDRSKIDPLLTGLNSTTSRLLALADTDLEHSAAEAMLQRSIADAQSAALGQARGSRNRGDRALLERQAVGEVAFATQAGARDSAVLRAEEEERDREFKKGVLESVADLNLNTAAFELDVAKADLGSVTNYLNNQFQLAGIQMQIDESMAEALLGFTRDMAALQFQYDNMDNENQKFIREQLMQKYGIDQAGVQALDQIRAQGSQSRKMNWTQLGTALIGGIGSGATAAIAKSDIRAKTEVSDATDKDFEDLMNATGAYTFKYIDPKDGKGLNFGGMAQDLEKSRFGEAFVQEGPDGDKVVDGGKAGVAALAGLSMLYKKIQDLEEKLS